MNNLILRLPFLIELLISVPYFLLYLFFISGRNSELISSSTVFTVLTNLALLIPAVIAVVQIGRYYHSRSFEDYFRRYLFSTILTVPLLISWGDLQFTFWLSLLHLMTSVVHLYDFKLLRTDKEIARRKFALWHLKPAQLTTLTFAGAIFAGTALLKLPISIAPGKTLSFVDALFTITSATCVTGLSTISISDNLTIFGQLVVLSFIQIGGLGIMTLQTVLAVMAGRSLNMKDRLVMQDLLEIESTEDLFQMIFDIVYYTLVIELMGGILLTVGFMFEGFDLARAVYLGFFHSISAFCNAGFSLFNNSLENFATKPLICFTIALLIILGGLGFIVLKELRFSIPNLGKKRVFSRFSLHTKIVLITTIALLFLGTILFFFGEYLHLLDGYSLIDKIQISFFQSVTMRTAGFNSINFGALHPYVIYLVIMFMFVGAGPGSTAGGIKVTTFAVILQSIRSILKGQAQVEFFKRKIPQITVIKSMAVTFISIIMVTFFVFLIVRVEPEQNFLALLFEVVSAFGTVGLSLGITPYLTTAGKIIISLMMYVGRVGPLTIALAVGDRSGSSGQHEYPEERIIIG